MGLHSDYTKGDFNMPKKVLIAIPPGMLQETDFVAESEHRTRSDLIREALRRYLQTFRKELGGKIDRAVPMDI